jgi:hypothetical protein
MLTAAPFTGLEEAPDADVAWLSTVPVRVIFVELDDGVDEPPPPPLQELTTSAEINVKDKTQFFIIFPVKDSPWTIKSPIGKWYRVALKKAMGKAPRRYWQRHLIIHRFSANILG